jgi:hypothetical protein
LGGPSRAYRFDGGGWGERRVNSGRGAGDQLVGLHLFDISLFTVTKSLQFLQQGPALLPQRVSLSFGFEGFGLQPVRLLLKPVKFSPRGGQITGTVKTVTLPTLLRERGHNAKDRRVGNNVIAIGAYHKNALEKNAISAATTAESTTFNPDPRYNIL